MTPDSPVTPVREEDSSGVPSPAGTMMEENAEVRHRAAHEDDSLASPQHANGSAPRNIIVLSDGTGNSSAKAFRTNVWKMYRALDLADPKKLKEPRQFAFYDNGVGTSAFRPLGLLGGVFGVGLARNVRDLYAFICRTYRPGDLIYVFGFSRGAFTVRVLVGLLLNQGVVPYTGNEAELNRLVRAAYRAYRAERFETDFGLEVPFRWLRDRVIDGWIRILSRPAYDAILNRGREGTEEELKIEFVGVWDTVAAYGLPIQEFTRTVDRFLWPLSMPNHDLSRRVNRAMHALSLDDERHTFHPQLWNEGRPSIKSKRLAEDAGRPFDDRPPNDGPPPHHIDQERLTQAWFAGVHSDIGGGYADDAVSYVPFDWIRTGAEKAGLRFLPAILSNYRALSDENGPIGDSRRGLGGYYRYNPRRIEHLTDTEEVRVPRIKVHESVLRRIRVGQDGYAPIVILADFDVVTINGQIVRGTTYLNAKTGPGIQLFDPQQYGQAREHTFNIVWWRRIVYFATLAASLLLLALPLILDAKSQGACQSSWCFVSDVIRPLAAVLPGPGETWIDTFASWPGYFLVNAAVIGALILLGSTLGVRAHDSMRLIWYSAKGTRPATGLTFPQPSLPGIIGRWIEALRLSRGYRGFFRFLTRKLAPTAFIAVVVYGAIALVSQATFAVRDSLGFYCKPSRQVVPVAGSGTPFTFTPDALCYGTGLGLAEGGTYQVTVAIPANDPWRDRQLSSGPYGIYPDADGANWLPLGVPLRRHLTQAWFKPMARVGSTGSDAYPLDPKPSVPRDAAPRTPQAARPSALGCGCDCGPGAEPAKVFTSEIVARTSGELFLYVNDGIFAPWSTSAFYDNNHGSACVRVEQIGP